MSTSKPSLLQRIPPLSIVRMLWKHKKSVLAGWVILSFAGALIVQRVPPTYRAEALILVDLQKIPERFVVPTVQVSLQDRLATLKQQILSDSRLQRIIETFHLYQAERQARSPKEITDRMRRDISITVEKGFEYGPGAFRVAYEGRVPQVVAGVVNEISNLFIAENVRTREQQAEGTTEFIDSQLRAAKQSLEAQEARLSEYKRQRMGELPQQEPALLATLSRLHSELQGSQDAINRAQQTIVVLENTLRMAEAGEARLVQATAQAQSAAASSVGGTPAAPAAAAPRRSEVLRTQLQAARLRYQDEHPEIKRLTAELQQALQAEDQERRRSAQQMASAAPEANRRVAARPNANASPEGLAEIARERERIQTVRVELGLARRELDARNADRERILRSIAQYQTRVEHVPMREQELASVTRDYDISRQNYVSLLSKKFSAEMATQLERRQQAERFSLLDAAQVPTKPVKPKRPLLYAAAVIGGLLLSMAAPLAVELKKNALLGEWELPPELNMLGRVSLIGAGASVRSGPRGAAGKGPLALGSIAAIGLAAAFVSRWVIR